MSLKEVGARATVLESVQRSSATAASAPAMGVATGGDGGDVSLPVRNSGGMSPPEFAIFVENIVHFFSKTSDFPIF